MKNEVWMIRNPQGLFFNGGHNPFTECMRKYNFREKGYTIEI
jgi:hypothetical protein